MSAASKALGRKSMALGPSVRLLLSRYAIDPNKITSTGPHKVLLKSDVLTYISSGAAPRPNPPPPRQTQPSFTIEKSVSKRGEVKFVVDELTARSLYARKPVTEEEIEIINAGGMA